MNLPARIVAVFLGIAIATSLLGCSATPPPAGESQPNRYRALAAEGFASGVFVDPSTPRADRWVILLPGASGLTIFDDHEHYFRAADALAAKGFTALVVDYKRAYQSAPDRPKVATGNKIAWAVERTIELARQRALIRDGQPGAVLAWSLGAEGLWALFADQGKTKSLGIAAAAAYYPANEDEVPIKPTVPLLILTGESDDVTTASDLRKALAKSNASNVETHFYPNANHGFDVVSIVPPRTISLIPLIGPSATFGYDASAAEDANKRLLEFLNERVHTP